MSRRCMRRSPWRPWSPSPSTASPCSATITCIPRSSISRSPSPAPTGPSGPGSASSPAGRWLRSASPITPATRSARRGGGRCTASRRSSGCWASPTRSARAPTPASSGSWRCSQFQRVQRSSSWSAGWVVRPESHSHPELHQIPYLLGWKFDAVHGGRAQALREDRFAGLLVDDRDRDSRTGLGRFQDQLVGPVADYHGGVVEAEDLGRDLDAVAVGTALAWVDHGYVAHAASSLFALAAS